MNGVSTHKVKGSYLNLRAVVVNGPMVAAALTALDLKIGRVVARTAIAAGAQVIASAWAGLVPVLDGYYQRSITFKTSSQSLSGDGAERILKGASAVVWPGVVPGVPDIQQPWRYASVLEFGGHIGPKHKGRGTGPYIPAQPSARPAFDGSNETAVLAVAGVLRLALRL